LLGSRIVLKSADGERELALEDFYLGYQQKDLRPNEIVAAIRIPLPRAGKIFRTYKLAKRFDQDILRCVPHFQHSCKMEYCQKSESPSAEWQQRRNRQRMPKPLEQQVWNEATLQTAMLALAEDYAPLSDMRASAGYRLQTAQNLLRRFWLETRAENPLPVALLNPFASCDRYKLSRGTDMNVQNETPWAEVGKSHPHESAVLHVSGSANYTDDIPETQGTLHAALGLSAQAHALVRTIDLDAVRQAHGVIAVFTARDFPGSNQCGPIIKDDLILADGVVEYVGQPLFAVVARSHELARRAARLAKVDYETLPAVLHPRTA
jgi:hypothetical protein